MLKTLKILIGGMTILLAGFAIGYVIDRFDPGDSDIELATGPVASRPAETVAPLTPDKKGGEQKVSGETSAVEKLPSSFLNEAPFLSQAPFAVWDPLHEEACEEASLIMAKAFLDKERTISLARGEKDIQGLVAYQEKNGYGVSISLEQLVKVARAYYSLGSARVESEATTEKIKRELVAGKLVIAPAAGKLLGNPNFRNGGPLYHMLVIKGYDATGFITNDPGTRLGESYHYPLETLQAAIHDWDGKDIVKGAKKYLVFD